MKLSVIKITNYRGILDTLYSSDADFCEKYVRNCPASVIDIVDLGVKEMQEAQNFIMYAIFESKNLCGYFGKEVIGKQEFLHGWFIHPDYRNRIFVNKFLKILKSKFSNHFKTGLYVINTPAQKFLKRAGFKEIERKFDVEFPYIIYEL